MNKPSTKPISEVFHFDGYKQIRTMFRPEDDTVLFCGKDVAEALGYKNTNDALGKHCKRGSQYPLLAVFSQWCLSLNLTFTA